MSDSTSDPHLCPHGLNRRDCQPCNRRNRIERLANGCYPGCLNVGCQMTLCEEFKELWRAGLLTPPPVEPGRSDG